MPTECPILLLIPIQILLSISIRILLPLLLSLWPLLEVTDGFQTGILSLSPQGQRGRWDLRQKIRCFVQLKIDDIFLTMLIQYLKIEAMEKSLIVAQRGVLIVGLIIATILVSAPASAGQERSNFAISGSDLSLAGGAGLRIPLSGLFSLDLNLSSVATGPSSTGEGSLGAPPIPLSKPPGSDLHYTRLGVGFSFKF